MLIYILLSFIAGLQLYTAIFHPLRSGGGEFNMQDRINIMTIVRRTKEIMAQFDDLMGALQAIAVDVGQKAQQMLDLEQKLTDINNSTPSNVDLQPAIDLATSIRQSLEDTAQQANGVVTDTGVGTSSSDAGSSAGGDLGVAGDPSTQPPVDVTSGDTGGSAGSDTVSPPDDISGTPQV